MKMKKKLILITLLTSISCCCIAQDGWSDIRQYLKAPHKLTLNKELELKNEKQKLLQTRLDAINNLVAGLNDYQISKTDSALNNIRFALSDEYTNSLTKEFLGFTIEEFILRIAQTDSSSQIGESLQDCGKCAGTGWHICKECHGTGFGENENKCTICNGWGVKKCQACHGSGTITSEQQDSLDNSRSFNDNINSLIEMASYVHSGGTDIFTQAGLMNSPVVSQLKD